MPTQDERPKRNEGLREERSVAAPRTESERKMWKPPAVCEIDDLQIEGGGKVPGVTDGGVYS